MSGKVDRNEPCPCGSGKKYKHCCLGREQAGRQQESVVEAKGYRGPGGAYAPSIEISRRTGWVNPLVLVNPERRFEVRDQAAASAERDLMAGFGALNMPFSDNTFRDTLRQAGYIGQKDVDLSTWAELLAEMEELAEQAGANHPALSGVKPECGLCGNTIYLAVTECCGNWVCDDDHVYSLFSYGRNSCRRNHRRYTVCGTHHSEGHTGRWQDCEECRDFFINTEMYVDAATNEWNFEKLEDPPDYEPTHCAECGRVIRLAEEGFMMSAGDFVCEDCADAPF
ncbi:MAG: SEC-C metal-binding domain-containing protein [Planctomycetota bacterium]